MAVLDAALARISATRNITPLTGRIWLFTLTADFNETNNTAAADLYDLDEVDTNVNITVEDPLENYKDLGIESGNRGVCEEQLDLNGTRHYIVVEWECP